jgi:DNA replication protein DnaC
MEKLLCWAKKPKNMLVFSGSCGIGKTYFSYAIYNHFHGKNKVIYKNEYGFLQDIRNSIDEPGGYGARVKNMAEYELIWILDDMGSSQMTEWQKEVLTLFLDIRYENVLPTIITSNIWIRDMGKHFTPRIQSRLAASENTIIELNGEDKRQIGM